MHQIKLRKATRNDSEDILRWRNDPEAVKASFSNKTVGREEHERWYSASLHDAKRMFFIAEDGSKGKIGMLRFDLLSDKFAEVSINLDPAKRGQGLGASMIIKGCKELNGFDFIARAKGSNDASIRVFEKAGFSRLFDYVDAEQGKVVVLGYGGKNEGH